MDASPTRAARQINLSYILHEPSGSAAVDQHLSLVEREEQRVDRLTSRLRSLTDQQLRDRVVRRDRLAAPELSTPESVTILTLHLGVWILVERLFRVSDSSGRYQGVPCHTQALDATTGEQAAVTLVRGEARLTMPELPVAEITEFWLMVAPVRPGATSLHLETVYLGRSDERDVQAWLTIARPWIETFLREHPTQWFAGRPLWSRPVESSRPEFIQGSGQG